MPDHDRLWRTLEESIKSRRWSSIRETWPQFVGATTGPAGSRPDQTLSDLLDSGGVLVATPAKNQATQATHPRSEIPELIFREGVFWLHKAVHVLGASENHVDLGMPTWSLSSAYQSAFFAARAIMAFLGLSVGEMQRVSVLVDLCRNAQGLRPQALSQLGSFAEETSFTSLGVLFDHRQVWMIFQRLLRVSSCDLWRPGYADYLAQLECGDITKQRHGLHYQLDYWVEQDLHEFAFPEGFTEIEPTGQGRSLFDQARTNFSLSLGATVTRMALTLFSDLAGLTNRLAAEHALLVETLSVERHPLFVDDLRRDFRVTPVAGS